MKIMGRLTTSQIEILPKAITSLRLRLVQRQGEPLNEEATRQAIADLDKAVIALDELVFRRHYQEWGTCADCAKREHCVEFDRLKGSGLIAKYCAEKGVTR